MFCASCGKQNESGVKFCTSCGASLQGGVEPSPAPPPAPPPSYGGGTSETPLNPWPSPAPSPMSSGPASPPLSSTQGGFPMGAVLIGVVIVVLVGAFLMRGRGATPPRPTPSSPVVVATSPTPASAASPAVSAPPPTAAPWVSPSAPSSAPVALPTRAGATTSVRLTEPQMCRSVDNQGRAVTPTTRFEPRWPFFCSVRAIGLNKGTSMVAFWQSPAGKTNKREIVSDRTGDYFVYFSLSPRPDVPWDLGPSHLSLIADGVLQQTVSFEVLARAGASPAAGGSPAAAPVVSDAHVQEAVPCASVDERHRPVNPTTTFPQSTSAVYVAVRVRDVVQGKVTLTRWYLGDKKIKEIPLQVPRDGSGWLSFRLTNTRSWPVGDYKVEVLYDGTPAATVGFTVR